MKRPPPTRDELQQILDRATQLEQRSAELAEGAARPMAVQTRTVAAGGAAPAYRAISVQARSANPKLAPQGEAWVTDSRGRRRRRYEPAGPYCASTYASIAATCPGSCPFRDNGCFAQAGAQHLTMGALDKAGRRVRGLDVSLAEADKLDATWVRGVPRDGARGGRDLRLHVGGDVSCEAGARALACAVERARARGLGSCWTYTHRWRDIPRGAWGTAISVLASCETGRDVDEALGRGYAAAITVDHFASPRRFALRSHRGARAIPCPFEAGKGITCVQCRLCFDDVQAGHCVRGPRRQGRVREEETSSAQRLTA